MKTDIMLDIETLRTKPGCIVLSVGAVSFDRSSRTIGNQFYRTIDIKLSENLGLTKDPSTVAWWMKQPPETRAQSFDSENAVDPKQATHDFVKWFRGQGPVNGLWAQGMDFDMPIWGHVIEKTGNKIPWKFWSCRDTRTAYDICEFDPSSVSREGTYHNALDDSLHQVQCLFEAERGIIV